MSETHHIAGPARGEPRTAREVGVRVRVPLTGMPSARWSRVLSARLTTELVGHAAVGHMHLEDVVQGSEIVLEGVEEPEAEALGTILARAVEAANRAGLRTEGEPRPANCARGDAERIARKVSESVPAAPRATGASAARLP